jgi:VCBS repeat-containing protein
MNSYSPTNALTVDSAAIESSLPEVLDRAFRLVREQLSIFAKDPEFNEKIILTFGENADLSALQSEWQPEWLSGKFNFKTSLRSARELNGAFGAFSAETNTIYLSAEFLSESSPEMITQVLLEEYGHFLDSRINKSDTAGDEGELFSAFVRGQTISEDQLKIIQSKDDHRQLSIDGEEVSVEVSSVVSLEAASVVKIFNFDSVNNSVANGNSFTEDGFVFERFRNYLSGYGVANSGMAYIESSNNLAEGGSDGAIRQVNGQNFYLTNLSAATKSLSADVTLFGFKNGVKVASRDIRYTNEHQTFTFDSSWRNINEVRFEVNSGDYLFLDNLVITTGTNEAPVITKEDLVGAVTEQITPAGNITDSGIITFSDVDLSDVHLVSATGTAVGSALGTLTAMKNTDTTGTGTDGALTWNYSVGAAAVEYLAVGQTKVESFNITLDDQNGSVITKKIDVTITGTNDAPVIVVEDLIGAVTEKITPTGNITDSGTITFSDVDLTDVHLVSANGTAVGSVLGTLTAVKNTDTTGTGTGGQLTWNYSVGSAAVEYLAVGQTKVDSFNITLNDQNGSVITKTIAVTITGTNDAPTVTTLLADITATENSAFNYNFTIPTGTFADVDNGDSLTYTTTLVDGSGNAIATPSWLAFTSNSGTWNFRGTPRAGDVGTLKVKVTATDNYAASVSDTFDLVINSLNLTGNLNAANNLSGTASNNILTGGNLNDILNGGAGNDTLYGNEGNDRLNGGDDNDTLYGGNSNDLLFGDAGNDILYGDAGNDNLNGGTGTDMLYGSTGDDILNGDAGDDTLDGGEGSDRLNGGDGNDTIVGSAGNDLFYGGAGNDLFLIDVNTPQGNDLVNGDAGIDTLDFTGSTTAVNVNLSKTTAQIVSPNLVLTVLNLENVKGGSGNDTLAGNALNNVLTGGAGADSFVFGGTTIPLVASLGVDIIGDFTVADSDKIQLSKSTFSMLTTIGTLAAGKFTQIASVNDADAAISTGSIVYNSTTGNLFYNSNEAAAGLGANGGQFAHLNPGLTLNNSLFEIVA